MLCWKLILKMQTKKWHSQHFNYVNINHYRTKQYDWRKKCSPLVLKPSLHRECSKHQIHVDCIFLYSSKYSKSYHALACSLTLKIPSLILKSFGSLLLFQVDFFLFQGSNALTWSSEFSLSFPWEPSLDFLSYFFSLKLLVILKAIFIVHLYLWMKVRMVDLGSLWWFLRTCVSLFFPNPLPE